MENASGLRTAETDDAGAVNGDFITCVQGTNTAAEVPAADTQKLERSLLQVFQQEQDAYVRIDWYGNVLFPHGILQDRLQLLEGAVRNLKEGRLSAALRKLYEIDSNRYAFLFEEEVYRHFTSYALDQSADRLKWGTGRIIGFENFFPVVTGLLEKKRRTAVILRKKLHSWRLHMSARAICTGKKSIRCACRRKGWSGF